MMNPRFFLFLSGAPYLARIIYLKGGRRVPVLDRTKRWRSAARRMKRDGRSDLEIICALGCKRDALSRALDFRFRL